MNVNDVKKFEDPSSPLEAAKNIYERQCMLEEQYSSIEKRPILVDPLNTREGQVLIKDFLWRIIEEVGETLEAKLNRETQEKIWEEMADGLHFMVGLCIHSQNATAWLNSFQKAYPIMTQDYHTATTHLVRCAGMVGNTLKLKPWKQTDVATDMKAFEVLLTRFIESYLDLCWSFGMTRMALYDYYMRKSEVNLFRIRSKY
jgi:hypothetical protein